VIVELACVPFYLSVVRKNGKMEKIRTQAKLLEIFCQILGGT